jgi:hypothetical protein
MKKLKKRFKNERRRKFKEFYRMELTWIGKPEDVTKIR